MLKEKVRRNYCWIIVIAASLAAFISNGLSVNCFSIILSYMRNTWGYTNSQMSFYNTVRSVASLLGTSAMIWMYKKISLRLGMALWCAVHGLAYIIGSMGDSIVLMYVMAVLMGFSSALFSIGIGSMLIRRWFRDKLGFALGIFSSSTGVATLIAPTVMTNLVETKGLKTAMVLEGLFIILFACLVFLLARSTPESMGLEPYTITGEQGEGKQKKAPLIRIIPKGRLNGRDWTLLLVASAFMGFGSGPALSNLSMHFSDCGFSAAQTAKAISIYGLCIGFAKIVYGFLTDRWGGKKATVVFGSFLVTGFTIVCLLKYLPYYPLQLASTGFCGAGYTAFSIGSGIWASELNVREEYDRTIQKLNLATSLGGVVGSFVPGILADKFGSYVPAYILSVVAISVKLISILIVYGRNMITEHPRAEQEALAAAGEISGGIDAPKTEG